jgi:hypothetical protein
MSARTQQPGARQRRAPEAEAKGRNEELKGGIDRGPSVSAQRET